MTTTMHPIPVEDLVSDALDRLPDAVLDAIAAVPILVMDGGDEHDAYGLYNGDGVASDWLPDRIVLYRDTLLRDFGHDPEALTDQVEITLRHEIAHHLGFSEAGVNVLGLR